MSDERPLLSETGVVALSLHQGGAPIDARERLLDLAVAAGPGPDRVLLATCHRVEVYIAAGGAEPREWASRTLGIGVRDPLWNAVTCFRDADAADHLFRVAVGLESAIAGEAQIAGQIRAALEAAPAGVAPVLRRLFERALAVGRVVRRSTALGKVRRSVGSLAVDEVLRHVDYPLSATVLVVGAGEMGRLAVRALGSRAGRVIVANRDRARAEAAAENGGARAIGLDRLPDALAAADAVISAADTRGAVLRRGLLQARAAARRLVVVDIAVPRSVPEDARSLPGLVYRTVDDLIDETAAIPETELAAAGERCAIEAERFVRETSERDAGETIRDVRAKAESVRTAQLARALRRLGHLDERDRQVVEALSEGLTNALLHETIVELKRERGRDARR